MNPSSVKAWGGGGLPVPDTDHLGSPSLVTQCNEKERERVLSRKKITFHIFSSHNSVEQHPHFILEGAALWGFSCLRPNL